MQDAYKSVYNWQFVHAIDFWSLVISASCEKEHVAKNGESPLSQLMYPLIQVALGAIRFVLSNSRKRLNLTFDSTVSCRLPATTPSDSISSDRSSESSKEPEPTSPSPRPSSKSSIRPTSQNDQNPLLSNRSIGSTTSDVRRRIRRRESTPMD